MYGSAAAVTMKTYMQLCAYHCAGATGIRGVGVEQDVIGAMWSLRERDYCDRNTTSRRNAVGLVDYGMRDTNAMWRKKYER